MAARGGRGLLGLASRCLAEAGPSGSTVVAAAIAVSAASSPGLGSFAQAGGRGCARREGGCLHLSATAARSEGSRTQAHGQPPRPRRLDATPCPARAPATHPPPQARHFGKGDVSTFRGKLAAGTRGKARPGGAGRRRRAAAANEAAAASRPGAVSAAGRVVVSLPPWEHTLLPIGPLALSRMARAEAAEAAEAAGGGGSGGATRAARTAGDDGPGR